MMFINKIENLLKQEKIYMILNIVYEYVTRQIWDIIPIFLNERETS